MVQSLSNFKKLFILDLRAKVVGVSFKTGNRLGFSKDHNVTIRLTKQVWIGKLINQQATCLSG